MDKNSHIDNIFRSKLADYEPKFDPEHWQMMKAAIESSPKKTFVGSRSFITKILLWVSALIIITSGIYTYTLSRRLNNITTNERFANVSDSGKEIKKFRDGRNYQKSSKKVNAVDYLTKSTPTDLSQKNNKKSIDVSGKIVSKENDINKKVVESQNSVLENNRVIVTNEYSKKIMVIETPDINVDTLSNINDNANAIINVDNTFSTVIDDYNSQKQKLDKKRNDNKLRSAYLKNSLEPLPDCKVSMVNNFVVNPAYTGFNQKHTVSISTLVHKPLFRPSGDFKIPFEYSIAYDFNFGKRKNYGIGLNYKRYLGAAEGSLAFDLTFAYRIFLAKKHNLRFGFSATYLATDINRKDLSFPDMIDPRDGFVYNSQETFPGRSVNNNFDLGIGVWYTWNTFYAGISAIHLTSPEVGIIIKSRMPREYMLSAGYGFNLSKNINTLPAIEVRYNGRILNVSPNMLFTYKKWFLFGLEFQNLRNAGIVLGYNLKNNIIINFHGGVPVNKDIIKNFGILDYAGLSMRLQFGNYR